MAHITISVFPELKSSLLTRISHIFSRLAERLSEKVLKLKKLLTNSSKVEQNLDLLRKRLDELYDHAEYSKTKTLKFLNEEKQRLQGKIAELKVSVWSYCIQTFSVALIVPTPHSPLYFLFCFPIILWYEWFLSIYGNNL